jgi:hypothetical protein
MLVGGWWMVVGSNRKLDSQESVTTNHQPPLYAGWWSVDGGW